MGMRRFWIVLSMTLMFGSIILSLGLVPGFGPNYGTDFKGGTEVEIAFKKHVDVSTVRDACHKAGFASPDVVEIADPANPNRFLIRVQEVSSLDETRKAALDNALCFAAEGKAPPANCGSQKVPTEVKFSPGGDKIALRYESDPDLDQIKKDIESVQGVELRQVEKNPQIVSARDHKVEVALKSEGDKLVDGIHKILGPEVAPESALRVEWVGPKAGKQLRDAAIKSVAIAIVFIMAYVAFRFDIRFAPGGIIALIHDAMVVVGFFCITRKEISLSTVAAVLTIVGYSIADTVIVYDRIRENLGKHRGKSFAEIINISVSETLSRTVLTSGAVLLSMACFFIWGTGIIKDFTAGIFVGVIAGTYSSIYVAAPMTEWIDRRFFAGTAVPSRKKKFTAKPVGRDKSGAVV